MRKYCLSIICCLIMAITFACVNAENAETLLTSSKEIQAVGMDVSEIESIFGHMIAIDLNHKNGSPICFFENTEVGFYFDDVFLPKYRGTFSNRDMMLFFNDFTEKINPSAICIGCTGAIKYYSNINVNEISSIVKSEQKTQQDNGKAIFTAESVIDNLVFEVITDSNRAVLSSDDVLNIFNVTSDNDKHLEQQNDKIEEKTNIENTVENDYRISLPAEEDRIVQNDADQDGKTIMPNLVGETVEDAKSILDELSINYEVVYGAADPDNEGAVISQSIREGDKVSIDSIVILFTPSIKYGTMSDYVGAWRSDDGKADLLIKYITDDSLLFNIYVDNVWNSYQNINAYCVRNGLYEFDHVETKIWDYNTYILQGSIQMQDGTIFVNIDTEMGSLDGGSFLFNAHGSVSETLIPDDYNQIDAVSRVEVLCGNLLDVAVLTFEKSIPELDALYGNYASGYSEGGLGCYSYDMFGESVLLWCYDGDNVFEVEENLADIALLRYDYEEKLIRLLNPYLEEEFLYWNYRIPLSIGYRDSKGDMIELYAIIGPVNQDGSFITGTEYSDTRVSIYKSVK